MCDAHRKAFDPAAAGLHVSDETLAKILAAYQRYIDRIAGQVNEADSERELGRIVDEMDFDGPKDELKAALEEALHEAAIKGVNTGIIGNLPGLDDAAQNMLIDNPYLRPWVQSHGAALVTQIDDDTRLGLRSVIDQSAENNWTWRDLKREVKHRVGLLERDSVAVQRAYDQMINEGMDEDDAARRSALYADKLLARRAENIARTEIVFGENYGTQASFQAAADAGIIGPDTKRVWIGSPEDGRKCEICAELSDNGGQAVGLNEPFHSSIVGDVLQPPAHPSCRCSFGLHTDLGKRDVTIRGKIAKADPVQHNVFGWLSVSQDEDGAPIVDTQGDIIDPEVLEAAAYRFVLESREMGDMHDRVEGIGKLIESMVFTADKLDALGLVGKLPVGWWVGFHVDDAGVWESIESGEYTGFSIGGTGRQEAA